MKNTVYNYINVLTIICLEVNAFNSYFEVINALIPTETTSPQPNVDQIGPDSRFIINHG